jgi:hypothetical protein
MNFYCSEKQDGSSGKFTLRRAKSVGVDTYVRLFTPRQADIVGLHRSAYMYGAAPTHADAHPRRPLSLTAWEHSSLQEASWTRQCVACLATHACGSQQGHELGPLIG